MKIQYREGLSIEEQFDAISEILHACARERGADDKLVIELEYMASCGYSYEQIHRTYYMGR